MRSLFGEMLQKLRAEQQISSRKFAISVGLDPSYYARIEKGDVAPPNEEVIARMALQLGVVPGVSSEWDELTYRASVAKGRIPDDVLNDHEIAEVLPAFFAKLKQQTISSADEMYNVCREMVEERKREGAASREETK